MNRKVKPFVPPRAREVKIQNRYGHGSLVTVTREDGKEFLIVAKYIKYRGKLLTLKTYNHNDLNVVIEIDEENLIDNRLKENV